MCVVAIAWAMQPKWRLLVAGNRDEFHARGSAPLARWDDKPEIVAGRDLVSGGTWLGISDTGRFAVVTNVRDADGPDPEKISCGALVTDWLAVGEQPNNALDFNPFNLICTKGDAAWFISNRPQPTQHMLAPGIHGLSNAIPDEHWPRKERLMAQMANWLAGPADRPETLLDLLAEEDTPDRDAYPVFIRSPVYGTRCSSVVAVDDSGRGQIIERRFDAAGVCTGETEIGFVWPQ